MIPAFLAEAVVLAAAGPVAGVVAAQVAIEELLEAPVPLADLVLGMVLVLGVVLAMFQRGVSLATNAADQPSGEMDGLPRPAVLVVQVIPAALEAMAVPAVIAPWTHVHQVRDQPLLGPLGPDLQVPVPLGFHRQNRPGVRRRADREPLAPVMANLAHLRNAAQRMIAGLAGLSLIEMAAGHPRIAPVQPQPLDQVARGTMHVVRADRAVAKALVIATAGQLAGRVRRTVLAVNRISHVVRDPRVRAAVVVAKADLGLRRPMLGVLAVRRVLETVGSRLLLRAVLASMRMLHWKNWIAVF